MSNNFNYTIQLDKHTYNFVLWCLATAYPERGTDERELHDKAWAVAELVGAESPHHFVADNQHFIKALQKSLNEKEIK